jgi:outer membrane lipoprotein LolB
VKRRPVWSWAAALSLLGLLLILGGCAPEPTRPATRQTPGEQQVDALREAHVQAVNQIVDWRVLGRFGVQTDDEGYHGRLDWRQRGALLDLILSGPFSSGGVRLRSTGDGGGDGIELSDSNGNTRRAGDADALLEQATGLQMPVAGLHYWVRGLPAPGAVQQSRFDDLGRLSSLKQGGWGIDYRVYTEVHGLSLPRKVFLERDGLQVRLVVERWEL